MIKLKNLISEKIIQGTTVLPTLKDSLPAIKRLGSKSLLTRTFQGIRMGAAEIQSGPITMGRIGGAIHKDSPVYNSGIAEVFDKLIDKFNLQHIVYCTHGGSTFSIGGDNYVMVPVGNYKTVWSTKISDIYADAKRMEDKGTLDKFPVDTYKNKWPAGNLNEVLVDCNSYYLISLRIPMVQNYMKKNNIQSVSNYKELHDVICEAIKPYEKFYK